MSVKVENLEKNVAKLVVTMTAEDFAKNLTKSFNKNKSRFNIPGFRKGKATQAMVEKFFGVEVLYEDAINFSLDDTYGDAAQESGLDIVSRPEISIDQVEKGKEFIYTATVAVKPEVTLGDYKGVEITAASTEVTEEDVEAELKKEQEKNSRLVVVEDRAVQDGDHTVIDFDGSVDGVRFDGGKGEDYPLVIGSKSFIAGFEDQVIGHKLGEEFDVNVVFPEDYHAKELAGQPAVFVVKIKEIKSKELPELNDEFASEISEFETLAEYKEDLKTKLAERKANRAKTENENAVVDKVVENASMDIPDLMLNTQIDQMINDYAQRMQSQGLPLDQYMQYTGTTMEMLREQMKPNALKNIRTRLTLEAVVKAENIEISEADIEAELQKTADNYKIDIERVKEFFGEAQKEQLQKDLAVTKAVDFLLENAKLA